MITYPSNKSPITIVGQPQLFKLIPTALAQVVKNDGSQIYWDHIVRSICDKQLWIESELSLGAATGFGNWTSPIMLGAQSVVGVHPYLQFNLVPTGTYDIQCVYKAYDVDGNNQKTGDVLESHVFTATANIVDLTTANIKVHMRYDRTVSPFNYDLQDGYGVYQGSPSAGWAASLGGGGTPYNMNLSFNGAQWFARMQQSSTPDGTIDSGLQPVTVSYEIIGGKSSPVLTWVWTTATQKYTWSVGSTVW